MNGARKVSLNASGDLRTSAKRLAIRRETGTELIFDVDTKGQSFEDGVIRTPWSDLRFVSASTPWPTLVVRWNDRMGGGEVEREESFRPARASDETAYAEAIRRVIECARRNRADADLGWLRIPGAGGKTLAAHVGIADVSDARAHVAGRVLNYWRSRVSRYDDPVTDGMNPTMHAFPSVSIVWDDDTIVFGGSRVGDSELGVASNGLSFPVNDVVRVELIEPWPRLLIEYEAQGHTFTEKFLAIENDELAFENVAERIAAVVEHRAASRLVAGWRDVPHAYLELVDHLPSYEGNTAGGAFRTSAAAEAEPILAYHQREHPGFIERLLSREHGPYQIVVTATYVYAEIDRNVFVRVPLESARYGVQTDGDSFYIFGRGTPLRIPHPNESPIQSILDEHARLAGHARLKR
jgi:hypothetical protein